MKVIHVSKGGPTYKISVNGKVFTFEDHPHCGPIAVHPKTGNALRNQPMPFLEAVSLWYQQGKRMDDDLCRWDREPEPIHQHIGGKRWKIVGYKDPERGF